MDINPALFISYSWEDDEHKKWVKGLASKLRKDGVDVKLDQWEVIPGDQLPGFMEKSIREIDYVLIICTPKYKKKSDNREGGVGYEGDIITGEVFQNQNHRKFIPILRKGEWIDSAPSWINGKYYVDLSDSADMESNYRDLITTILNIREVAPPLGHFHQQMENRPVSHKEDSSSDTEIKIKGILVDEIGEPLNDGSPGCALYRVPFELNRYPDNLWSDLFKQIWDRPPQWTTRHRPGIGYVVGKKIILEKTTIEEVKDVHKDTLKLVVNTVNKQHAEIMLREKLRRDREEQERNRHQNNIRNIVDGIEF